MQYVASSRQMLKIVALSVIFSLSVVLGNMSLRYIPVSFNQAIGATTPAFTAFLSFVITWKAESFLTYATLVPVVLGIVIASNSEPSWNLLGVILCFSSTGGTIQSPQQRIRQFRLLLRIGTCSTGFT